MAADQSQYHVARFLFGHRGPAKTRYTPRPEEIPSGRCECGCGLSTPIATKTMRARRWFRGHPQPFAGPGHKRDASGAAHHLWKGGRCLQRGYVMVLAPDHPAADKNGYIREHRLVMERVLGRRLTPEETVHHKNEEKDDNRPENLEVMSRAEHAMEHDKPALMRAVMTTARYSDFGRKGAAARWEK